MDLYVRRQGIDIARTRYRADVRLATSDSGSTGYAAWIGTIQLSRTAFATPEAAWDAILERLVIVRPGAVVLTSIEYGDRVRSGIELIGGRMGSITERQRLEIRAMTGYETAVSPSALLQDSQFHDFQVFTMLRQYRDDAPSRDIRQSRVGGPFEPYRFPSLGAAAEYVVRAVNRAMRENPAHAATAWVAPAEPRGARSAPLGEIAAPGGRSGPDGWNGRSVTTVASGRLSGPHAGPSVGPYAGPHTDPNTRLWTELIP